MGMGIFPQIEKDIEGIDPLKVCGRALYDAVYHPAHKKAHDPVIQLEQFIGYDAEELAGYVSDLGVDTDELPIPEPTWFDAKEGIQVFETILTSSHIDEDALKDAKHILDILKAAEKEKIRFYLTTDMP